MNNMKTETNQQLLEALNWRYATKSFDPSRKLPAEVWQALEESLVLSPSSYGLQPYRFLNVTDPAKRAELKKHSWNQTQIVDASHLVVFLARTSMVQGDVDRLIQRISQVRHVAPESLEGYRGMMVSGVVNGISNHANWAARQSYIALGNLLTSAALLGVDACPMEGISTADYDRVLGLEGSGYTTVVVCALGYRAENDKYATLPKVRFEQNELVETV
jgi:nitroreductase